MQRLCHGQLKAFISSSPHDASAGLGVKGSEPDHHLGLLLVIHEVKRPLLDLTRLDHGLRLDPRVEGVDPTQKGLLSLLTGLYVTFTLNRSNIKICFLPSLRISLVHGQTEYF